jgi:phosphate/sulfate permease
MMPREGFVANLVTAALVGPGAALGIPMSTTHVSAGAIMSIAASEKSANAKVIRNMLIAWLVTVPVSGLLGITMLVILRRTS